MLFCCAKNFTASYKFHVYPNENLSKKIEFSYCPHCDNAVYKEIITYPNGTIKETQQQKGIKAEELFEKAKFNRLNFLERLKQGSKGNMGFYWFDGLKDLWVRDFNGMKSFKLDNKYKVINEV